MRVLTWNLWWRFADWPSRHDVIRAVLAEASPDICGLQEVWEDADGNAAELLARNLGMHWTWAASPAPDRWQRRLDLPDVQIGNAVLSRWPILEHELVRLPRRSEPDEGRTALFAAIQTPRHRIPFFTCQLNSAPRQSALPCEQVAALASYIATRSAPFTHPPVLTGDFNAEPDSDEMRLLCGHKTAPAVPGLVLVDVWRYADPAQVGLTWDRRNPHVRATREPSARIDYVLVGLPGRRGCGAVRAAHLVGDRPVEDVWPSGHAAVLADLEA